MRSYHHLSCFVAVLSLFPVACGGVAVVESGDSPPGPGPTGGGNQPRCPTGCLELGPSLSVGDGAHDVIATDCNADGHLDLVVASEYTYVIQAFRGRGDGSFEAATVFDGGPSPWMLAAVDFNEDGQVDLAIGNFVEGAHVVLGDGNCGFGPPQQVVDGDPLGQWSTGGLSLAAGDLDGDGHADLVSEADGSDASYVTISWGHGDGSFEPTEFVPVTRALGAVTLTDLDADGHVDLVGSTSWLLSEEGLVSVLRGVGGRAFAPVQSYPVVNEPEGISIADFDGDGRLDAATVSGTWPDDLSLLRGDGQGGLSPAVSYKAGVKGSGGDLEAADFDGDGRPDLVLTAGADSAVNLVRGSATGVFAEPVPLGVDAISDPNSDWNPFKLTVGDLNEDGHPDVAATNFVGVVSLLLSKP